MLRSDAALEFRMMMGIIRNWWSHSKTVASIWIISLLLFYSLFQFALNNSSPYSPTPPSGLSSMDQRSRLYDRMARDLDDRGAVFLKQGKTSNSLSLSDLFTLKDGSVTTSLKEANPPVRANVLYLSTKYSVPISDAVKQIFNPYFDKAIWFQNSSLYHFSMFHASHHIVPVPASEDEIEAEANAVRAIAEGICPVEIVLDRVILTSTGVLLGCWQVSSGTDPITIRSKLRTALPRAPEKQIYDEAILHTSLARLIGPPKISESQSTSDELEFFHKLVAELNNQIRGFKAVVSELWYVEEYDLLALALDGRMKIRRFPLSCSRP